MAALAPGAALPITGVPCETLARGDGLVGPEQLLLAEIADADRGARATLAALGATRPRSGRDSGTDTSA